MPPMGQGLNPGVGQVCWSKGPTSTVIPQRDCSSLRDRSVPILCQDERLDCQDCQRPGRDTVGQMSFLWNRWELGSPIEYMNWGLHGECLSIDSALVRWCMHPGGTVATFFAAT